MADESKSQADGKSSEEIENLTDEIDARCARELVIDHAEPADEVLHFVGACKVDLVVLGTPESDRSDGLRIDDTTAHS